MFFLSYFVYWCGLVAAISWQGGRHSRLTAFGLLAVYVAAICLLPELLPWQRLFLGTVGLLQTVKCTAALCFPQRMPPAATFLYMTIWPGVRPLRRLPVSNTPNQPRQPSEDSTVEHRFARGYLLFWLGIALTATIAAYCPQLGPTAVGWLGLAALLLTIHLGFSDCLTALMQLSGWDVAPLFEKPWKASGMRDFWSHRWNLAFVEMNQTLLLPPLRKCLPPAAAIFGVFLVSGLLHELGVSYAAGAGWGGPLAYFVLQGVWFLCEQQLRARRANPTILRIAALASILLPLPLLFTEQFRLTFIVPLFYWLHDALTAHDLQWYVATALWCGAAGNFCTMLAGLQVPARLQWRTELQRLRSFNRKILINYYVYIGLLIATWGTLTIVLHDEMMRGDRAALYLAALIAAFWSLRVIVDVAYFKASDWPTGAAVAIGRPLLTTLFISLSLAYWSVVVLHLISR